MSLTLGTRIGPYEIVGSLGQGGMGEVYRAHDTMLGRDVAVKVLPEAFAHDPDRLARFEREAKTLASLNHPNIAAIYGLEEGPADSLRQGYGRPPKSDTKAEAGHNVQGPAKAGHYVRGEGPADVVAGFSRPVRALVMELVDWTLLDEVVAGNRPAVAVDVDGGKQ